MPMSLVSLLLDFYPMSLCCLWAQFKIQSYKHHQMKCVEVRMEGTDSAYRVIVLKQFFHFENLYLRPLTSFCPSNQTSPQSLGPLWPLSSLPSLFFKLWWLRKWKEYGWVESTLNLSPFWPQWNSWFISRDRYISLLMVLWKQLRAGNTISLLLPDYLLLSCHVVRHVVSECQEDEP